MYTSPKIREILAVYVDIHIQMGCISGSGGSGGVGSGGDEINPIFSGGIRICFFVSIGGYHVILFFYETLHPPTRSFK